MSESSDFREYSFLRHLRQLPADPRLLVPIGDDAAVLSLRHRGPQVLAIDTVVEGTHVFSGPKCHEELARKVVRSNVSDLAAMAAEPDAALLSLKTPRGVSRALVDEVMDIVFQECQRFGIILAGGDTVSGPGGWVLTLAITGETHGPAIERRGARPGDLIFVTGELGGSILGHHTSFEPRLPESRLLRTFGPPSAMADISDGFLRDLGNILELSAVGAEIDASALPVRREAHILSHSSGRRALDHALYDGEDFELVGTISQDAFNVVETNWTSVTPIRVVGRILNDGYYLLDQGRRESVEPRGYEHV